MPQPPSVLYLSYDGILEPLGQSQVLEYLLKLAPLHPITLISFEKSEDWQNEEKVGEMRKRVLVAGIRWVPLRYHRKPSALATAFDVLQGIAVASFLQRRHRFSIVHARSYVASLIALFVKRVFGPAFIFDMRGFWADERVEGKLWPAGSRLYRIAKYFETRFFQAADVIVSLTQTGVDEMRKFPTLRGSSARFEVIPTCANLDLFRYHDVPEGTFTVGYVGSIGLWYDFDRVARWYRLLLNHIPDARFSIWNRDAHELIREKLLAHGIPESSFEISSGSAPQVAAAMAQMNLTAFYIRPSFSKKASAPTKLGEFLGCGVPVLANTGVGDMDRVVEGEQVGVLITSNAPEDDEQAVQRWIALGRDPQVRRRCREVANRYFSLDAGVSSYHRIYDSLQKGPEARE